MRGVRLRHSGLLLDWMVLHCCALSSIPITVRHPSPALRDECPLVEGLNLKKNPRFDFFPVLSRFVVVLLLREVCKHIDGLPQWWLAVYQFSCFTFSCYVQNLLYLEVQFQS